MIRFICLLQCNININKQLPKTTNKNGIGIEISPTASTSTKTQDDQRFRAFRSQSHPQNCTPKVVFEGGQSLNGSMVDEALIQADR